MRRFDEVDRHGEARFTRSTVKDDAQADIDSSSTKHMACNSRRISTAC